MRKVVGSFRQPVIVPVIVHRYPSTHRLWRQEANSVTSASLQLFLALLYAGVSAVRLRYDLIQAKELHIAPHACQVMQLFGESGASASRFGLRSVSARLRMA